MTEFDDFLKKVNECHPSIKFEYEMSKTEINFLNTTANQPTDKVIYTANQNIQIPLKNVLPIARH